MVVWLARLYVAVTEMLEILKSLGFAIVILFTVELGIWVRVCLALSMRYRGISFIEIMKRAPYRILWIPKSILAIADVVIFIIAAGYYRSGGQSIVLAIVCFVILGTFTGVAFWEGIRAVRRYEQAYLSTP